jgi:hypothetical protein
MGDLIFSMDLSDAAKAQGRQPYGFLGFPFLCASRLPLKAFSSPGGKGLEDSLENHQKDGG